MERLKKNLRTTASPSYCAWCPYKERLLREHTPSLLVLICHAQYFQNFTCYFCTCSSPVSQSIFDRPLGFLQYPCMQCHVVGRQSLGLKE